ncbi:MAG TPA: ABC transporter permease, partial [Gemmatimonadaceae bacterium]
MLSFILRRLLLAVPTLAGVLVVTFLLLFIAPGDPVMEMVGERADSTTVAQLRHQLHLDESRPRQFAAYAGGVLRGDLGTSFITGRPIARDVAQRFPKTLELAGAAMLLAAVLGISVGVITAARPNGWLDRLTLAVTYLGISFPVYWVGLILILVFAMMLHWLPPSGSGGIAFLILPACALGTRSIAFLARMTRSSMLDVLGSDYVRTARAKG